MKNTMGNRENKICRNSKGFTLLETLLVIAIIVVLLGLSIIGVIAIQKELRQRELDSKAEMIYMAAQNRLTELTASGRAELYEYPSELNDIQPMGLIPLDSENPTRTEESLYYVTSAPVGSEVISTAAVLLPESRVEKEIRDSNWVIEYDPASGSVYAVFYSEKDMSYIPQSFDELRIKQNRKKAGAWVGYYGGDAVISIDTNVLNPTIDIRNEEMLHAVLSCNRVKDGDVSFKVNIEDKFGNKVDELKIDSDTEGFVRRGNMVSYDLVLDKLDVHNADGTTTGGNRFHEKYPELVAGSDITITLTAVSSSDLVDSASVSGKTNSLFAEVNQHEGTGEEAVISYCRHLQNLDVESGVNSTNENGNGRMYIKYAVQKNNLHFENDEENIEDWYSLYGERAYKAVNANYSGFSLLSYCGSYTDDSKTLKSIIFGLDAKIGMFDEFKGIKLKDITLSGAKISGDERAGAIAGTISSGSAVTVSGCQVYLSRAEGDLTDKTEQDKWITGSKYTGGLIARTDGTVTIKDSFAATVAGNLLSVYTGGLVGHVSGTLTLENSYADCYLYGQNTGGLVGAAVDNSSNITISSCYSAGYITAEKKAAGFVPETVKEISNAYSAVAYMKPDDKYANDVYATAESCNSTSKVYYLNSGGIVGTSQVGNQLSYKQLNGEKADYANTLGDKFSAATGGDNTNAYNLMKQGLTDYSFPKLANLPHYGDWKADFEENRPVYYEVYQGSGTTGETYGIYGANLDTLADSGSAIGDGYGVIYASQPKNDVTVKYGGTDYTLDADNAVMITTGRNTYYLLKFPTAVVNTTNAPEDFYHEISIDGTTYYYNPHFAKNITTEKPSKVSNVYVRTARQLHNMSMYYSSYAAKTKTSVYTQELDIKYDTYKWSTYAGIEAVTVQNPIGTGKKKSLVTSDRDTFNSTYNGGNHVIEGVSFVSESTYYTGLFGYNKGKLRNIAVVSDYGKGTDRYIAIKNKIEGSKATAYAGVLAGRNSGTINNCAAAGYTSKIYTYRSSSSYIGGLVGYNSKSIRNSSAECPDFKISETYAAVKAGGFTGTNTGNISGCYSIGRLNIIDARQGNAAAAGFAGSNSGVISKAYCAVSITISGSAKGYGFAPAGGNISDCKYLNKGTYYYTEVLNAYDIDAGAPRVVPVKADELINDSPELGEAANNAYYRSKTGGTGYPYPAVVKKGTDYVHYGNWPVETELGNVGVFYWEYEDGGPNSGYHFRYLGVTDDKGIGGSSLCTAHDDGGIVKEFGYGYYYKTEAKDKVNLQMTDFADAPVVNADVSAEIKGQISGYEVVAYTTTTGNTDDYSSAASRKGKLYLDKKDNKNNPVKVANGTWKLSYTETKGNTDTTITYQYSVCPFFANSFSLDGKVNGSSVTKITYVANFNGQTETPGTEGNKYQIRSIDQLQFINWNYRYLNATSYVNSTSVNWDSFTYLKYASGNTADYEWNFYWDQTHDIESQQQPATEGETKAEQENFTPIGSLYYNTTDNQGTAYIAYFGGVYNGDSYAIKNINIKSDAQMVGLFGITIAAKLENIVMYSENDDTIQITEKSTKWYCVGGLVGFAAEGDVSEGETSKAVFRNCTVSGYQIIDNRKFAGDWGGGSIGGLAGATNMDISKCTAVNDITTNAGFEGEKWQNIRVGGLVGNCRSTIDGCYAGGSITSGVKTITGSKISDSASVWIGGINGGIVMIDVGKNLNSIIGTTTEVVKVKNSYSYVNLPATGANQIRGSQSIASIGEMQEEFAAIDNPYLEITNCYAYADSVKNAQDYKDTSKHSSQYWSGVDNNNKADTCIFYLDSNGGERYISLDNDGKSPYVTYEQLSAASGKQDNVIDFLNQNGVKFGFVTTEENGARIDGKYSYPGDDPSLEGVNYPFPTVLTQQDTDGRTVNVHYGTWPKGDLYWQNSMNSFDMIENDELQMNLIFKGTYNSDATPVFKFLDEEGKELTVPLLEFESCNFVTASKEYQVRFKALKEGTVTVRATLGNDTAEALVSITADLLITAEPAELNIPVDDTAALGLTVKSVNGTIDFENNVKWTIDIDDPNVASFEDPKYDSGQKNWIMNVTGLNSGETSITAIAEVTKDSKTFTKEINIVVNVTEGNDTIDFGDYDDY